MVQKLSGLIRYRKEQSEFRIVLHYNMRTIMWNGYKFLEKMKHHIFLKSDIWTDICCFYRTFTFLIDKTDSFQELCSSPHLT
jgi:hypothetical protein